MTGRQCVAALAVPMTLSVLGFWLAFSGIAPAAINMGLGAAIAVVAFLVARLVVWVIDPPTRHSRPDPSMRYRETNHPPRPSRYMSHGARMAVAQARSARRDPPPHGQGYVTRIEPRDESDPFCTCPACGLLGSHLVEVTVFEARWVPNADGERVEIPRAEDPADGTRRAERTCVFCGHIWYTPTDEACTREIPDGAIEAGKIGPGDIATMDLTITSVPCPFCEGRGHWSGPTYCPPPGHTIIRESHEQRARQVCPQSPGVMYAVARPAKQR